MTFIKQIAQAKMGWQLSLTEGSLLSAHQCSHQTSPLGTVAPQTLPTIQCPLLIDPGLIGLSPAEEFLWLEPQSNLLVGRFY